MCHSRDGVVVKFHSGHCTACDSPCAWMPGADGLQVRLEETESTFCITRFEQLSCLFYENFDILLRFFLDRFWNNRCWDRLRNYFFDNFLLGDDNVSCTFKFLNRELVVIIMVVMDCFLKKVFWVFNSSFFRNRFNGFHIKILLDLNRGFHDFHWNR